MKKLLIKISEYKSIKSKKAKTEKARVLTSLFVLVFFLGSLSLSAYSNKTVEGLSDSLIRLHVIANSDSDEDQELKRSVRDAVIKYMEEELKGAENIDEVKRRINNDIGRLEEIAAEVVKSCGKDYEVHASIGKSLFPTKAYGDIVLPAGSYQALKIVIGEGQGANWWCVLFPPLCFVDVSHGTVPDSVKEELKSVLTEEEYKIIDSSEEDEDIPVKIKFKIVEIFQNSEFFEKSKIKFAAMLKKIFD